jgi:hypothetical protein
VYPASTRAVREGTANSGVPIKITLMFALERWCVESWNARREKADRLEEGTFNVPTF